MSNLDENGFARIDEPDDDPQLARAQAIAHCDMCDDDGYRGHTVCDHQDHRPAAQRGINLIRETMGWPKR